MTKEPDTALLWAKQISDKHEVQDALAYGYRAGQAAAEARVKELEELVNGAFAAIDAAYANGWRDEAGDDFETLKKFAAIYETWEDKARKALKGNDA